MINLNPNEFPSWNNSLDRSGRWLCPWKPSLHKCSICFYWQDQTYHLFSLKVTLPRPLYNVQIIIWKTYTCFIVRKYFLPHPCLLMHLQWSLLFLFCKRHTKCFLGKGTKKKSRIFNKGDFSFALCFLQVRGEPSLPSNGLQLSALNGLSFLCFGCKSLCTQQQMYFHNYLKLPQNFLLSKWIKMTTSVSLPHLHGIYKTTQLVQLVKISTMGVHCHFLLPNLMILCPTLTWKSIIFELIKTANWAEQRLGGETRDLKWSFKGDRSVGEKWWEWKQRDQSKQEGSTSTGSVLPGSGHLKLQDLFGLESPSRCALLPWQWEGLVTFSQTEILSICLLLFASSLFQHPSLPGLFRGNQFSILEAQKLTSSLLGVVV